MVEGERGWKEKNEKKGTKVKREKGEEEGGARKGGARDRRGEKRTGPDSESEWYFLKNLCSMIIFYELPEKLLSFSAARSVRSPVLIEVSDFLTDECAHPMVRPLNHR